MAQTISLAKAVPSEFGDWTELKSGLSQISLSTNVEGDRTDEQPYDDVVMRTYSNSKGEQVMLALAYAREQRQEVKIHRPEVCYKAQGYKLLDEHAVELVQAGNKRGIPGQRLLMGGVGRMEAVSYWMRIGAKYPRGGLDTRATIFQHGIRGIVPDAILVRASSILSRQGEAAAAYARQEQFLANLVQAMRPMDAPILIGAANNY